MARSGVLSILSLVAREAARQQRHAAQSARHQANLQLQASRLAQKQAVQLQKASEISQKSAEKAAKSRYVEERLAAVEEQNTQLATCLKEMSEILGGTLSVDDTIAFQSLRLPSEFPPFAPPPELIRPTPPPQKHDYLVGVTEPRGLARLVPGAQARYERALKDAESIFESVQRSYERSERDRRAKLAELQAEFEQSKQTFLKKSQQRNQEVDELEATYRRGNPDAIVTYNTMVLERSNYPEGFPQQFRLAYVPESKELVIEYQLPSPNVVPTVQEYRYVKARNAIEAKPSKPSDIKELYQDVVVAVALRTLHEVLEADQAKHLQVVVFNGFVATVDPATGKDIRPCLISIRVTGERFLELDLRRIDKRVCLRNLGAQVSQSPNEMVAVKPVVEFDMVDKRFVDQGNILSDLESRPNLMDLKPFDFETVVANLFQQMGIESKLTRSSRDGGVDVVGFDKRPVLGGKVVIQAKRYRHTVGVSAVRDLYGTMMNEGANKGILVTTSGYGPDAFDFARDKPIELIEGGGLLYLLEQVGIKARIVMPLESAVDGST
ncbi:MAG: restriction endonuclease [Nitrospira defluvii]|nr:restriction endonuclease [Nitrospira defluvii]